MTARVIALCNQKGGVGKSTTAFHLARAAAARGMRILVIDADPQGNLTTVTAAEAVDEEQVGLADVLSARADETLREVLVPGVWPGVDVVPTSGPELGGVRDELVIAGTGREARLRDALVEVVDEYDLVLIDCAPSLDQLTINSLTAADAAVIVAEPRLFSSNGIRQLYGTLQGVRAHYNEALRIGGVVVNKYEPGTVSGPVWLEELRETAAALEMPVLDPPMRKRVVIADAAEAATGLDQWPRGEGRDLASIYDSYLTEILERTTR